MEMEAPEVEQNSLAAYERYLKALSSFNSSKDSYYRLLDAAKTSGLFRQMIFKSLNQRSSRIVLFATAKKRIGRQ